YGIERSSSACSIPYRVIRGVAFYERAEVKDALSMLRLAVNPRDAISLARVANIPTRGLGKKSVELLGEAMAELKAGNAEELWKALLANGGGLKGKQGSGVKALASDMLAILANEEKYRRGRAHDHRFKRV
ncbi:3'-5' exonuclease, partial [Cloacibacillus evryensis]|uniref:3'-5' exonuclease n=1 Tax=Cloacibacillus evryensis TaxID=508460 RepID=UPI00273216E6